MRFRRAAVLACTLALTAGLATPAAAAPTIVELPTLAGARYSSAGDVNNAGVVVGGAQFPDYTTRALKWSRDGQLTELPKLHPDDKHSGASGINSDGTIVGISGSKAVQWNTDGSIKVLGPVPSHYYFGPGDINDNGTVFGNAQTNDGRAAAIRLPGDSTATEELPALPGERNSAAADMNNAGTIVGHSNYRAARWFADGRVDAFPVPADHNTSEAVTIDGRGDTLVQVTSNSTPGRTLYKWHADGSVTQLPSPSGLYVQAISDTGVTVGNFPVEHMQYRAVTLAADGTTTDLGALPGDTFTQAIEISGSGDQVVGYSGGSLQRRPVVWRF